MFIDGKLVVSKKKKLVLVEELRKLGFKPFPKVIEAKKAGENEPLIEDEEVEDSFFYQTGRRHSKCAFGDFISFAQNLEEFCRQQNQNGFSEQSACTCSSEKDRKLR